MRLSPTLSFYLGRQFGLWLVGVLAIVMSIALLFDVVEMMRRASGHDDVPFTALVYMSLFKLPHLVYLTLPFLTLFAAMITFWRLARANEAVVARAAGISAWQFIFPAVAITALVGILQVTVINPMSAAMLSHYEKLEAEYLKRSDSLLSVSRNGLWLRQNEGNGAHTIIHASGVAQDAMELRNVIVLRFSDQSQFVDRVDASTIILQDGYWLIPSGWRSKPNVSPEPVRNETIKTDLTETRILDSFAPPATMSFWDLPEFINVLENAGFSGHRHRLHYHALLALPLLLGSMILVAASFTLRINRRTGTGLALMSGLFASFLLYFITDIVHALGLSATIPVPLAAWTPAGVAMLTGLTMLFHLEDG